MEKQGDLVQGTLDMLVLKALARGAKHGYGVAEWIHESSNDVLHVEEGALYPALHRLELRGCSPRNGAVRKITDGQSFIR